jgi:FAD/FMN-containing dehydrogenase
MTCDNLIGADVVTSEGKLVHCNKEENSDLFWALRGGGGNFGIVTNFEFQLFDVGPIVKAGPVVFSLKDTASVLKGINDLKCSEELTPWCVIRQCPPFPFVPEEHHFKTVCVLALVWIGAEDQADMAVKPYLNLATPLGSGFGPVPLAAFNQAFDPLLTPGFRNYWKTCNMKELNKGAIDAFVAAAEKLPNFGSELFIGNIAGAALRVKPTATAYSHRTAPFFVNCHTRWENPQEDDENRKFARDLMTALKPHSDGTQYQNFVSEGDEGEGDIYGVNAKKLAEVKMKYDPKNFFSFNYNIAPKSA